MIAVVDHHAERRVVIGAATAAREGRRFVHGDALAAPGKAHRGRKPGKSSPDDMDGARHNRWLTPGRNAGRSREGGPGECGPAFAALPSRAPPGGRGSSDKRGP